MKKSKVSDEQLTTAVMGSTSYAEALRKLGLKPAGSNYATIQQRAKALGLSLSHMRGRGWNTGERFCPFHREARPLDSILVEHSTYKNMYALKCRILREQLKPHMCESCGATLWLGAPIPLELHHINGVRDDLRLENLQLLCPNCHTFTENYRGRGIKKF